MEFRNLIMSETSKYLEYRKIHVLPYTVRKQTGGFTVFDTPVGGITVFHRFAFQQTCHIIMHAHQAVIQPSSPVGNRNRYKSLCKTAHTTNQEPCAYRNGSLCRSSSLEGRR